MRKFQTKSYTVVGIVSLTTLFSLSSGWNEAEAAAPGNNLTPGGACEVTEGPNKGKKGTYGEDGWCEGDWGGTECGESKCKDVETKGPSLGGVSIFDGGKIKTTVTHQIYETSDKNLMRCSTTILAGTTSSVTAVCFPVEVLRLESLRKSADKQSKSIADAINNAIKKGSYIKN